MIYVLMRNEWQWIGDCSQEGERERISLLFITLCYLSLFFLKRVWKFMNKTIDIKHQNTQPPLFLPASFLLYFPPPTLYLTYHSACRSNNIALFSLGA